MLAELEPGQITLVHEVDRILDGGDSEADPRHVFARLGRQRLLAVHYPVEYGGRGLSLAEHAAVAERISESGLPDTVHLVTVQAVGCTILTFGTEHQRARWLPPIAHGLLFASLLLSEEDAGSDPTRIDTTAVPDGDGWRISGVKTWSMWTDWSTIALCSARTGSGAHHYQGISLFLVDLTEDGVGIVPRSRAAGDPYFVVTMNDVRAGADSLVGELHRGWALLPTVIDFERGGFDHLARATSWLRAAERELQTLPPESRAVLAGSLVQFEYAVTNARLLAYHAAHRAEGLLVDEVMAAYAKLACGRAAQAIARWAGEELLPVLGAEPDNSDRAALRAAVLEAPELTICSGPQELQLDVIASEIPIGMALR
jgi:alkylation response protein AidB-like acyl-CoA dehydrogenase